MLYACCNHGSRISYINTSLLIISFKAKPLQVMKAQLCICKNVTNFTLSVISTCIGEVAPLKIIRVGHFKVDLLNVNDRQLMGNYFDLFYTRSVHKMTNLQRSFSIIVDPSNFHVV